MVVVQSLCQRKWSKLIVVPRENAVEKAVAERDRVLSEKVTRWTEPVVDPISGEIINIQTTETVERVIEREVTNKTVYQPIITHTDTFTDWQKFHTGYPQNFIHDNIKVYK